MIDPAPSVERIGPVSVNLRLGRKFSKFRDKGPAPYITSIRVHPSLFGSADLWEHMEDRDYYELEPGGFVLGQTLETVAMPSDLMALVEGRSSWARVGLSVHMTAPKIDPGFKGNVTLEIANMGTATVRLQAQEDEPAQLLFMQLSKPLDSEDLYGADAADVFQGQTDPIPRRR